MTLLLALLVQFGIPLLTVAIPLLLIVSVITRLRTKRTGLICTRCGTAARAKLRTPGSLAIEIVLWLAFLIPGLIYSLWRATSLKAVCPACGSADLVPTDTPVGREIAARDGVADRLPE